MKILTTLNEVRDWRKSQQGKLAFVPTMGALHQGHLSLIKQAKQLAETTIVSIFVNPTQFAPTEDLSRYPRPLEQDLEHCRQLNINAVWTPQVDDIYPPHELDIDIDIPALCTILEGANRPTHFQGVCRVVAKLFNIVQPDVACFGQKDYQQLKIIQALTAGLSLPIKIIPCPIIREPDGLAMSSRNIHLTPKQRQHAIGLSKALHAAEELITLGEIKPDAIEHAMIQILKAHHANVDYAAVRHPNTLAKIETINAEHHPVVCLIAVRFDKIRLIDNRVITLK